MKNALISPQEILQFFDGTSGVRVAEVAATAFPVAAPLFWVECDDTVTAEGFYWDGSACVEIPPMPEPEVTAPVNPQQGEIPQAVL